MKKIKRIKLLMTREYEDCEMSHSMAIEIVPDEQPGLLVAIEVANSDSDNLKEAVSIERRAYQTGSSYVVASEAQKMLEQLTDYDPTLRSFVWNFAKIAENTEIIG